jgi:hypothetical protein
MNRSETALRLGGEWRELLKGRDVSGTFTLAPCEVLLLNWSRP